MFGLIKLAAYALFGYVVYEFVMGMSADAASQSRGGRQTGQGSGGAKRQQLGARSTTQESDGATATHPVGRGVVSR